MFQFKVIHNVLPTRATLYRHGISESPICNLCNAKEQTLHHLLINCNLQFLVFQVTFDISLVRYQFEHSKINSISPRAHALFSLLGIVTTTASLAVLIVSVTTVNESEQ